MTTEYYLTADTPLEQENRAKVGEAIEFVERAPTVKNIRVMPDACPVQQRHVPVGAVVATKNAIHPQFHSADACCSLYLTDMGKTDPKKLMDIAFDTTHFGMGGREDFPVPKDLGGFCKDFETHCLLNPTFLGERMYKIANEHFGTQGDGNHFLFIGRSKATGNTVLVTHHGSRGFGAELYKKGVKAAEKYVGERYPNVPKELSWLPYDEDFANIGTLYWDALKAVRAWTKANHAAIHAAIMEKAGAEKVDEFWNEHNFVFKEGDTFYHAKGATPMAKHLLSEDDERRIIPLNMGAPILITRQKHEYHKFAPHGAGRNESRTGFTKRVLAETTAKELIEKETEGLDIRFFTGKADITELPSSYKNPKKAVSEIHAFGLAEITDEIEPYGSIMCGHQKSWRRRQ